MKKAIFDTHGKDSRWNSRIGEICEIIRPLTESETDIFDVGNMYKIRFKDGIVMDAFEDELTFIED